jgi:sarcosine oxidase subunit beta
VSGVEATGIDVDGGEITAVRTSVGTVRCSTVVCAAGPWSARLGEMAGVDLPVVPLRRQILVTEPLGPELLALYADGTPMTIDAASTFYLHREGPGLLMGMSWQGETPGFHEGWTDDWTPDLLEAMERRAPALLDVGLAHRWAGFYEVTPDHNALVGEAASVSRFLFATGFSGHGFLQGPAVGEVVRDLYLRREPVIDVSSLSAERFASGRTVHELNIV